MAADVPTLCITVFPKQKKQKKGVAEIEKPYISIII